MPADCILISLLSVILVWMETQVIPITLPAEQAEFIRLRAEELGLANPDAYLQQLIEAATKKREAKQHLDQLLLEGLE